MKIVLFSDDIALVRHWENSLHEECTLVDELDELYKVENSLIILNFAACELPCETILSKITRTNKVLVLHRVPDLSTAKKLLAQGAKGYGNAMMRSHFIVSAVETIRDGMIWLYPEFTSMLINEIPERENNSNLQKLEMLSDREREVALFLKDGLTYKDIAEKLDITPRTVKAHASHVYQKLSVKDRVALALLLK